MQADNYIQSPEDFISYNRYAYCLYNPFKYTDPSGERWVWFDYTWLTPALPNAWGADCYWVDDDNRMLEDELARLNAFMDAPDNSSNPCIGGSASSGRSSGSGTSGAPPEKHKTQMEKDREAKMKEAEEWRKNHPISDQRSQKNDLYADAGALVIAAVATGLATGLTIGFIAAGLIMGTIFIPSSNRIPDNVYQAEHTTNKSKSNEDKHTRTRSGELYDIDNNNRKGNKRRKYQRKRSQNQSKHAKKGKK